MYAYYEDGSFRTYDYADTNAYAVALITDRVSILIDKIDVAGGELSGGTVLPLGPSDFPFITELATAKLDYNGLSNTLKMIEANSPIAVWCRQRLGGNGYIPALGELIEIRNNTTSINNMLIKIGGYAYDARSNQSKGTSTLSLTNGRWRWSERRL